MCMSGNINLFVLMIITFDKFGGYFFTHKFVCYQLQVVPRLGWNLARGWSMTQGWIQISIQTYKLSSSSFVGPISLPRHESSTWSLYLFPSSISAVWKHCNLGVKFLWTDYSDNGRLPCCVPASAHPPPTRTFSPTSCLSHHHSWLLCSNPNELLTLVRHGHK